MAGSQFHSSSQPGHPRRRLWVPAFIMVSVLLMSRTAGIQTGQWTFTGIDKLGHFFVFGLLGISWARCMNLQARSTHSVWVVSSLFAGTFGLLDESLQLTNPERYFEWADLGADLLGAAVFSALYAHNKPLQAFLELEFRELRRLILQELTTNSAR